MMPLTFLCLVLWLHFTHLHVLRASTTDAQQVLETTKVAYVAAPDGSVVSFHKELLDAARQRALWLVNNNLEEGKWYWGHFRISNNAPMNSLGSTEKNMNNQSHLRSLQSLMMKKMNHKKLLRASNEIANLMDVDYYSGWPQPRRTPPIHNSVPKDEDNAEP
ncbi:hypothetical protein IFM89_003370 [Coptis chinensis]|uniref:Uncharacterized protein n=1 Tax=Coptis chinensis TaxID=261450 RepID=A0A835ITI6_9MAGN|nr:hypothetical protein IFM89_003370 [Coptis chinensis]